MKSTELIYRVLSGEASDEEQLQLEQWKELSVANRVEYDDLKMLWDFSQSPEQSIMPEEGYRQGWMLIRHRVLAIQRRRRRLQVIAVVFIFLLILSLIGLFAYHQGSTGKPSLHPPHATMLLGMC